MVVQACLHAFVPEGDGPTGRPGGATMMQADQSNRLGPQLAVRLEKSTACRPRCLPIVGLHGQGRAPSPRERAAEGRGAQALLRE